MSAACVPVWESPGLKLGVLQLNSQESLVCIQFAGCYGSFGDLLLNVTCQTLLFVSQSVLENKDTLCKRSVGSCNEG